MEVAEIKWFKCIRIFKSYGGRSNLKIQNPKIFIDLNSQGFIIVKFGFFFMTVWKICKKKKKTFSLKISWNIDLNSRGFIIVKFGIFYNCMKNIYKKKTFFLKISWDMTLDVNPISSNFNLNLSRTLVWLTNGLKPFKKITLCLGQPLNLTSIMRHVSHTISSKKSFIK